MITGASGGTGRAIARRLGVRYRLVLSGRTESAIRQLQEGLTEEGYDVALADWESIVQVYLLGTARVLDAFLPLAEPGTSAICVGWTRSGRRTPSPSAPMAPRSGACSVWSLPRSGTSPRCAGRGCRPTSPQPVEFLCSDSASYICDLRVDGGIVAARQHRAPARR